MKLKSFLFFAFFALPLLAQSSNQHINLTIYYLLLTDITGGKPDHHLLNDPAKVKAAKIREMEAIKGIGYALGSSVTEEKGIKAFDRREIIEALAVGQTPEVIAALWPSARPRVGDARNVGAAAFPLRLDLVLKFQQVGGRGPNP